MKRPWLVTLLVACFLVANLSTAQEAAERFTEHQIPKEDLLEEVLVQVSFDEASTEDQLKAKLDELMDIGLAPSCVKSQAKLIELQILKSDLPLLAQGQWNYTVMSNPARQEFLRFIQQQELQTRKRNNRQISFGPEMYQKYHSNQEVEQFLQALHEQYPTITRLHEIGRSVRGVPLWVLQISDNPDLNELGEPEVKYVANMHGDEVVGRELVLYFAHELCSKYGSDSRLTRLVDNLDIYLLPTMNPDGFANGRRSNANGVDLNRNFPDQFTSSTWGNIGAPIADRPMSEDHHEPDQIHGNFQPEVVALMAWTYSHSFVLSANFHGGSVVANIPFDGNAQRRSGINTPTPDDPIFRHLAWAYSRNNPEMRSSYEFTNGITNGAQWYVLYGGMQDWNYLWTGDMEITVELSYDKWPRAEALAGYWENNRHSLRAYLEQALNGVWGVVYDAQTGQPLRAGRVTVDSYYPVLVDPTNSDYYKVLVPGRNYTVTAQAPGFAKMTKSVSVSDNSFLTQLDFHLQRM